MEDTPNWAKDQSLFVKFLKEEGTIIQNSMLWSPHENGVAERWNSTIIDTVRIILCNNDVPLFLWSEALKSVVSILNKVPSKAVSKMHLNDGKHGNWVWNIYTYGVLYGTTHPHSFHFHFLKKVSSLHFHKCGHHLRALFNIALRFVFKPCIYLLRVMFWDLHKEVTKKIWGHTLVDVMHKKRSGGHI